MDESGNGGMGKLVPYNAGYYYVCCVAPEGGLLCPHAAPYGHQSTEAYYVQWVISSGPLFPAGSLRVGLSASPPLRVLVPSRSF